MKTVDTESRDKSGRLLYAGTRRHNARTALGQLRAHNRIAREIMRTVADSYLITIKERVET